MLIYVKTLAGRDVEIEIDQNGTIDELKKEIEKKTGIPPDQIRTLMFGGIEITSIFNDSVRKLSDFNIGEGSTLHIVISGCFGTSSILLSKHEEEIPKIGAKKTEFTETTGERKAPCSIRLKKEFRELISDEQCEIMTRPLTSDFSVWEAFIKGPKDTPYENGVFEVEMEFLKEYPFKSPKVKMVNPKVPFHPGYNDKGEFSCRNEWRPEYGVKDLLYSIYKSLEEPKQRTKNILNQEAYELIMKDMELFNKKALEETEKYCKDQE